MRKLDKKCDENPRPFLAILVFKPHSSPCWKEGSLGQAKGEVFYTGKSLHPRADLDMGELTRWAGALSL